MSYTPLVRWRNFTLQNLKAILDVYPDIIKKTSREKAYDAIESKLSGYKRTAYQFACQLGLECKLENFEVQNYLYTFDDENLEKYLNFWFKMYITPNPYVNSKEEPISIFEKMAYEVKNNDNGIDFEEFCEKYFGEGKSTDILKNAIKKYGAPMDIKGNTIFIKESDINELDHILSKVNKTLPMKNNMDKREFFERFSYKSFCDYYDINNSIMEDNNTIEEILKDEQERVTGGQNTIIYGIPGSGKSYTIEQEYCSNNDLVERTVFHPDYTHSDFIGQILPSASGGDISYKFIEGPFTRLLNKAYNDPQNHYFLIIEEINRGNAPAIFGGIFQLLDRLKSGESEYGINDLNIAEKVYTDKNKKIKIPSNMSIIATMNTSDQNVFTLDTAFQRRWNMRMIIDDVKNNDFADTKILDTSISWKRFNEVINDYILENSSKIFATEDKRIGSYFIKESDLLYNDSEDSKEISKEKALKAKKDNSKFPEKVLKYLWDDVFKLSREEVFNTEKYGSLEKVIQGFIESKGDDRFSIFNDDVFEDLILKE